ncbi:MAG TPA: HTH domain-containing protein [Candidatus Nitrosocosmicus sp.]|nr:HTH domain-containing protein [Candidatus Nitrosocosmicus sp.]
MSESKHRSNNKTIAERREKVMILLTKGLKGYQIAEALDLTPSTVSRDINYLSKESNDNLKSLVQKSLPFLYSTSIEGIKSVLKECWIIYESDNASINYLHKLNSLKLAKECNESLFKLVAEGPCIVYLKELEERLEKVEDYKKEDS